jgi:hypothetical protein
VTLRDAGIWKTTHLLVSSEMQKDCAAAKRFPSFRMHSLTSAGRRSADSLSHFSARRDPRAGLGFDENTDVFGIATMD